MNSVRTSLQLQLVLFIQISKGSVLTADCIRPHTADMTTEQNVDDLTDERRTNLDEWQPPIQQTNLSLMNIFIQVIMAITLNRLIYYIQWRLQSGMVKGGPGCHRVGKSPRPITSLYREGILIPLSPSSPPFLLPFLPFLSAFPNDSHNIMNYRIWGTLEFEAKPQSK